MTNSFLEDLRWRGMLQDMTPELETELASGVVSAYIGFDPTATSLHIGSLSTLMLLVHFQRSGHRPILLVGGATGMVGDPSGKSEERKLLSEETIRQNVVGIQAQLERFLSFDSGPIGAIVVNNYDWFGQMGFLEFLRDVGKHLTVNYMMAKDSVSKRMETGISFTEFSYQLLQAYDYYYLWKHHECKLQMGGSDQWGNITSGIELIRRMQVGEAGEATSSAQGLTAPLLTKADGSKFGKSESGNIWLDATLTSPYKFYQFLLNTSDDEVVKLVKVFSLEPRDFLENLLAEHDIDRQQRKAQKHIAAELTERVHGAEALTQAIEASKILFGDAAPEALRNLSAGQFLDIFEGVPSGSVSRTALQGGLNILQLLVDAGASPSKAEAKRLIQGGGLRLNRSKVESEQLVVDTSELIADKYIVVQQGKKKYHLVIAE
jgi:tyrosyl-tRNA synthetase